MLLLILRQMQLSLFFFLIENKTINPQYYYFNNVSNENINSLLFNKTY